MGKTHWLLAALVCVLLLSLSCGSSGGSEDNANVPQEHTDSVVSDIYTTTTITAGYPWDIENDLMRVAAFFSLPDLEWTAVSDTEYSLTPQWSTKLMVVTDMSFDDIDEEYIANQKMLSDAIPGASLAVGTIIICKTFDGSYAKLQVVQFFDSQDFSFTEASSIEADAKAKLMAEPVKEMYSIQLKWKGYNLAKKVGE
jgi:hypothetical protein